MLAGDQRIRSEEMLLNESRSMLPVAATRHL